MHESSNIQSRTLTGTAGSKYHILGAMPRPLNQKHHERNLWQIWVVTVERFYGVLAQYVQILFSMSIFHR